MLAFITPASLLLAATSYTVDISGVIDTSNQSVAYSEFSFSTIGGVPGNNSSDEWSPTSDWQTHRPESASELLPDLQGPRKATALTGQVLKLDGEPLPHVTLEIGNRKAQSDSTGRFLLTDIPAGHQVLVIEGATANSPGKSYGASNSAMKSRLELPTSWISRSGCLCWISPMKSPSLRRP